MGTTRRPAASAPVPGATTRGALVAAALLIVVLTLYALFLLSRFAPAITSPDANGYYAQGSVLATTGRTWFRAESDCQYVGVHWLEMPDGRLVSRYPPGLAVVIALVFKTLGYKVCVLLNPALAVLALWGLYLVLRRLAGPWWALAGVVLLAINPVFSVHAISEDAHMPVTCLLVWGLVFLLRWSEHGRLVDAFVAGLFFGAVPAVRYPEAIFGVAVVVFLVWEGLARRTSENGDSPPNKKGTVPIFRPAWRAWLAAAAGAALPLAPLLIYNHLLFGAFWRTGYALTGEQSGFGLGYFWQHFISYVRQIQGDGLGMVFALGVVGMIFMAFDRRRRAFAVTLALLAFPAMLLYMFYYWDMPSQRFLLPTYPCYLVAGVWLMAHLTAGRSRALAAVLVAAVFALQVAQGGVYGFVWTRDLGYQKEVLARVTDALEATARRGDVVISDPQVLQHLDFVRRWKLGDLSERLAGRPSESRRGGGPSPFQSEKRRRLAEQLAAMTAREREAALARELREWAGPGKVYYVGTERELAHMPPALFGPRSFRVVARVPIPEPPALPQEGPADASARRRDPAGVAFLLGEREVVIAEWLFPAP